MTLQKHSMFFEPSDPIITPRDFTDELIKYCDESDKNLIINHEGMEPIVTIDGNRYICILEQPRMINIPFLPVYLTDTLGYKWVYLYKYEPTTENT